MMVMCRRCLAWVSHLRVFGRDILGLLTSVALNDGLRVKTYLVKPRKQPPKPDPRKRIEDDPRYGKRKNKRNKFPSRKNQFSEAEILREKRQMAKAEQSAMKRQPEQLYPNEEEKSSVC
jgi:hypothetical protein